MAGATEEHHDVEVEEGDDLAEIRSQLEASALASKHGQEGASKVHNKGVRYAVDYLSKVNSVRPFLKPTPPKSPSVLAHALSGMVGALLAEVVTFPVDTIKLQMQTAAASDTTGSLGILLKIVGEKGIGGLYKGLGASVFKESIHSFNYWVWHDAVFRTLSKHGDTSRTPLSARLMLNLIVKWLNWLCTVPFEVISSVNQLAVDSPGFFATAVMLWRQGGIANFYRGLAVSMVLAVNPAMMNTLITTELRMAALFKMTFMGQDHETARDHGPGVVGLSTGFAKFIATLLTYPLIRAKVLQQTATGTPLSPFEIWKNILRAEGTMGLYRGILAMSYKTVLWNTLMMMMKHKLGPKRAITPPATPPLAGLQGAAALTWMAREPLEIHSAEKLDEILQYVRNMNSPQHPRIQDVESRLDRLSMDMAEIKHCLLHMRAVSSPLTSEDNVNSRILHNAGDDNGRLQHA